MWGSRSLLSLGVRWRVGNGQTVKIWKDAWLGGLGTGKVISPPRLLDENTSVDALIDRANDSWKFNLLSEVFLPVDVDRIVRTPFGSSSSSDERVWAYSEDGKFRVRDLYLLTLRSHSYASSSEGHDSIWSKLWKLKIHPKAKVFLWRAAWDILPHGANLRKKGIPNVENEGLCKRCGALESGGNVLFFFPWAKQVWSNGLGVLDISRFPNFRELLGFLTESKTKEEVELLCMCAWQIWCARNDFYFEKIIVSPELCYKRACDMLHEFRKASHDPIIRARREDVRWYPPDPGVIKINVDAAIKINEDRFGLGVVARDSDGCVVLAAAKTSWLLVSVERAELSAFQWAVELALEYKWAKVVFEGNAQVVVKALQGSISRSFHSQIVVDNVRSAVSSLDCLSFLFCFREANFVAHHLAKWAVASICNNVWCDGGPRWISDLVLSDFVKQ